MAWTTINQLDAFDFGPGSVIRDSPLFWLEDIVFLANQDGFETFHKKNIIFQGIAMSALVGSADAAARGDDVVIIACPPHRVPLKPVKKTDPPPSED